MAMSNDTRPHISMTNRIWGRLIALNPPIPVEHDLVGHYEYKVGRNHKQVDFVVHDDSLRCSKIHFKLYLVEDMPCIEDVSSNGTCVNGTTIHKKRIGLVHGTHIEIKWDLHFVFLQYDSSVPPRLDTIGYYYVLKNQVLGEGAYAIVRTAIDVRTADRVACKEVHIGRNLQKGLMNPQESNSTLIQKTFKEVEVLKHASHPNIVSVRDVSVDDKQTTVFIFMPKIGGGDLFDYIVKQGCVDESEAKFIFYQALMAVEYLHGLNICHRDIKAENILMESSKPFSRLLLSDFGMAKALQHAIEQMQTMCGTSTYMPPEMTHEGIAYTKQVDCWALGVLLYTMLGGALPFGSNNDPNLRQRIANADFSFDSAAWNNISQDAKDLITKLLVVDPTERYTASQALAHRWIAKHQLVLKRLYVKALSKAGITSTDIQKHDSNNNMKRVLQERDVDQVPRMMK